MTNVCKLQQELLAKLVEAGDHRSATGILNGSAQMLLLEPIGTSPQTQLDAALGFNTMKELYNIVETVTKFLVYSSMEISNVLVPRLVQELVALAPIYLPFSAEEAQDKRLLGVFKPSPWSFLQLADTVALPSRPDANLDSEQSVGPARDATARPSSPRKKAVTIDQLIAELYSDTKNDP